MGHLGGVGREPGVRGSVRLPKRGDVGLGEAEKTPRTAFERNVRQPVRADLLQHHLHPNGVHMVVQAGAGGHSKQRQRLLHRLRRLHPIAEVVQHDGGIAEEIGEPVNLHVRIGIGNGGQRVDAQFRALGDVEGVRHRVLVTRASIGGNIKVRDLRADVLNAQLAWRRFDSASMNTSTGQTRRAGSWQQRRSHRGKGFLHEFTPVHALVLLGWENQFAAFAEPQAGNDKSGLPLPASHATGNILPTAAERYGALKKGCGHTIDRGCCPYFRCSAGLQSLRKNAPILSS